MSYHWTKKLPDRVGDWRVRERRVGGKAWRLGVVRVTLEEAGLRYQTPFGWFDKHAIRSYEHEARIEHEFSSEPIPEPTERGA